MQVLKNITNGFPTSKRAALYYKSSSFYEDLSKYVHTNNWEIVESARILNEKGFSVDVIDRGVSRWSPPYAYDLFLGLGVGPAGINFPRHALASQAKTKVLLSQGPQPDISARLVLERYENFNKRHGSNVPPMRAPVTVTGSVWEEIISATDYIINIGEEGNSSFNSLVPYEKPIFGYYPAISPQVTFNKEWLNTRDRNSFLCFAGNGFICKGVDLLVEAFAKHPNKTLHICGPDTEKAFFLQYNKLLGPDSNIKYHGFVQPGGDLFNSLASQCSYAIFHSAAEGCCTSVATAIKAGLVPVINEWTGILIKEAGILIPEKGDLLSHIENALVLASELSNSEYSLLLDGCLKKGDLFSQESFTTSYSKALDSIIESSPHLKS